VRNVKEMTMTKEEIIEMVMQIGGCERPEDDSPALKMFIDFAKLVAEHEREACAVFAEEWVCGCGRSNCIEGDLRSQDIAESIRARGQV